MYFAELVRWACGEAGGKVTRNISLSDNTDTIHVRHVLNPNETTTDGE